MRQSILLATACALVCAACAAAGERESVPTEEFELRLRQRLDAAERQAQRPVQRDTGPVILLGEPRRSESPLLTPGSRPQSINGSQFYLVPLNNLAAHEVRPLLHMSR